MIRKTTKHLTEKTHKVAVKPHALHEQNKMRTAKKPVKKVHPVNEQIIKKTTHVIDLFELEDKIQNAVEKFYGKALDVNIRAVADDTIIGTFNYKADNFGKLGDVDKAELSEMFKNPGSPLNDISIRSMDAKHTSNGDILKIQFDVSHITVMEENTKKSAIDVIISALNESNHDDLILRNHIEG